MVELYHKINCPFSAKVRNSVEELGLRSKIQYHDIVEEPEALTSLKEMTGKTQVPCLVIDGKPMLESDDIIQWLQANMH